MATELDAVLKELHEAKDFVQGRVVAGITPVKEELDRVAKALAEAQVELARIKKERLAHMDGSGRITIRGGRLAGYDAFDLRLLDRILGDRVRHGMPVSERLMEEVREARKSLGEAMTLESIMAWSEHAEKKGNVLDTVPYQARGLFRQNLVPWSRALIEQYHKRALDSTTSAKGDELVPTFEAAELWLDVNLETLVLPLIPQVAMPTNPFDWPTQFGDVNWYPTTENVQVTTTDVATAKVTLTAQGLKAGVPFSDELEEDAIIAFIPELRASLVRNAAEVIDDVILNADQTTANGINSDGATISKTTAGKAHWLLGFDGIIHQAIVDNSANVSINKNAAIDADIFNRVIATMGKYGVARRRGDVVYVCDPNTAARAMSIAEVETVDSGMRSTISAGELSQIYGRPIITSQQMKVADTDGKVTDSGGNTVGRILGVNTTQWKVGFRRQITVETDREPGKGQTTMYVSLRIALTERSGSRTASGTKHTAIAYNITGVA